MVSESKTILDIPNADLVVKCTLFEDDKGAEELTYFPKNRPRTKHIAVKYYNFREAVRSKILIVKRVDTLNQLADIFTKPLARIPLERLRMRIQGWTAMLSHRNIEEDLYKILRLISIGH